MLIPFSNRAVVALASAPGMAMLVPRAETIARTETSRALNQGKLQAMKASGEKASKYLIITYDNRTSEVSKAMGRKYGTDEKAIPLDKEFSVNVNGKTFSGQTPPFMPNDRDAIVFVLE